MAVITFPGTIRAYYPFDMRMIRETSFQSVELNGTFNRLAMCGKVWYPERTDDTTKEIQRIGFRLGTVSKGGGSNFKLSIQGQNAFEFGPDDEYDDVLTIANSDSGFVSNTWYRSAAFSPTRGVTQGEAICIVLEWGTTGRLGSDVAGVAGRHTDLAALLGTPHISRETAAGSWITSDYWPNVVLEFDDGTFGTLEGTYITNGITFQTFNSSSPFNEWGMQFTVPFLMRVDQAAAYMSLASTGSDFDLCLYNDTTLLTSRRLEGSKTSVVGIDGDGVDVKELTFTSEQTLQQGYTYVLSIKPVFGFSVSLYYESLAAAGHRSLWGTTDLAAVRRSGSGAWQTVSTQQIPLMGVRLSALQDS